MTDRPFTVEVSYTERDVKYRVITVVAPTAELAETMASDQVRKEGPQRLVLTARRVQAS